MRRSAPRAAFGLALVLVGAVGSHHGLADEGAERERLRAAAERARPTLIALTWIPSARPTEPERRVAIVLETGGPMVAAGPVVAEKGRWIARRADGETAEAAVLGHDAETFVTVLRSPWSGLPALPDVVHESSAGEAGTADPRGTAIVLVGAEDELSFGAVRARGRRAAVWIGEARPRPSNELWEATLASLPEDVGAPWIDAGGKALALHVSVAAAAPEGAVRAATGPVLGLPIETARLVAPLIARHGRVPRAGLGVWTRPADAALRAHLRLDGGHLVVRLEAGGAAERGGLHVHDLIVGIGHRDVGDSVALGDALLPHRPGESVTVRLLRGGERLESRVVLSAR